jgi:outer membrane protein assembly factor BamB
VEIYAVYGSLWAAWILVEPDRLQRSYLRSRNGRFYAIREKTGNVAWSRDVGHVTAKTCSAAGFISTATIAPDPTTGKPTVYVYGASSYLYAMNAATGLDVWPRRRWPSPRQR